MHSCNVSDKQSRLSLEMDEAFAVEALWHVGDDVTAFSQILVELEPILRLLNSQLQRPGKSIFFKVEEYIFFKTHYATCGEVSFYSAGVSTHDRGIFTRQKKVFEKFQTKQLHTSLNKKFHTHVQNCMTGYNFHTPVTKWETDLQGT
jgi:hypothetical protein